MSRHELTAAAILALTFTIPGLLTYRQASVLSAYASVQSCEHT